MAGIQLSLTNIGKLISIIGPFFLTFFLVMLSIFNQNFKGLFYIVGILLLFGLNVILMNFYKEKVDIKNLPFHCNLFEIGNLSQYSYPEISSMIISFTLIYLLLPMIFNNQMNFVILFTLISMLVIDAYSKKSLNCSNYSKVIAGTGFGLIFGALWYFVILFGFSKEYLYFNEIGSNNVVCKRPSKQTFKCSVYKNGKLISSNIA